MTCDGYNFTVKTATSILIDALVMSGPIEEEEDPSVFVISASALESLSPEVELQTNDGSRIEKISQSLRWS